MAGVGDLVHRTENGHKGWILSGRTTRRSSDVVCGLHRACEEEERGFLS
jgi:hypothetical protein